MISVEIYFDDLKPEKQKELLKAIGADEPKEMNWDVPIGPIAIVDFEEEMRE